MRGQTFPIPSTQFLPRRIYDDKKNSWNERRTCSDPSEELQRNVYTPVIGNVKVPQKLVKYLSGQAHFRKISLNRHACDDYKQNLFHMALARHYMLLPPGL
jgi:hypothetical protein